MLELLKITTFVISTMTSAGFDCEVFPIMPDEGSLIACTNSETMLWQLQKIIIKDGRVVVVKFSRGKTT